MARHAPSGYAGGKEKRTCLISLKPAPAYGDAAGGSNGNDHGACIFECGNIRKGRYGYGKQQIKIISTVSDRRRRNGYSGSNTNHCGNIYPLIHAIYYVDTVEIVEIEKQYKQECV